MTVASLKMVGLFQGALHSQMETETNNATEQIACAQGDSGSFCAFYQKGASGTAQEALDQLQNIINHGCRRCGSTLTSPSHQAGDGLLTVNAKANPCCKGNCHC